MKNKAMTAKICESCGQTFECGALAGSCWCMKIPTNPKTLETLRKTYNDCLCEDCLNESKLNRVQNEPGSD